MAIRPVHATRPWLVALLLSLLLPLAAQAADREHRVLLQGNGKLAIVGFDGQIEWEMKWGGIHDLHVTDDGTIMVQRNMREIVEIDPDTKEVIWSYNAAEQNGNAGQRVEVHAFQPLSNGDIMIAESGPARIIEINRKGEIQKEFKLKVDNPHPHTDTRLVRKLDTGNYLVCHERDGTVREYDGDGKVVWEYEIPMFGKSPQGGHGLGAFGNKCFSAERLANGNTLIGTGNGHSVLEVTPDKRIVWQIHQNDLPDIQLAWVTTLEVLPNGNYMIGNCHAGPRNPLLVEVNPETKEVVWQFDQFEAFGNSVPNSRILESLGGDPALLSIGDPAPQIKIAKWLKGEPFEEYEGQRVYVVEFWATWCGPCIKMMPHMSELQAKYGDRVRFVGITEEDRETVEAFLASPSAKGTWNDVIDYALALDDNSISHERLFNASGQIGIPCAFIVKNNIVEWIGSPQFIDDPLDAIVAGNWDRAAAKESYERELMFEQLWLELEPQVNAAYGREEWDEALSLVDRMAQIDPENLRMANMRMTILRAAGRNEELITTLTKTIDTNWEQPERLDVIAWGVAAARGEKAEAALQQSLRAAERALELSEGKSVSIIDTLARVQYELGDIDMAIELSRKAVAIEPTEYAVKALKAYEAKKKANAEEEEEEEK